MVLWKSRSQLLKIFKKEFPRSNDKVNRLIEDGFIVANIMPRAIDAHSEMRIADWGVKELWFHVSDIMWNPYELWLQECELLEDVQEKMMAGAIDGETALKAASNKPKLKHNNKRCRVGCLFAPNARISMHM